MLSAHPLAQLVLILITYLRSTQKNLKVALRVLYMSINRTPNTRNWALTKLKRAWGDLNSRHTDISKSRVSCPASCAPRHCTSRPKTPKSPSLFARRPNRGLSLYQAELQAQECYHLVSISFKILVQVACWNHTHDV